jgi:putative SOS response-associated peptidase YedK
MCGRYRLSCRKQAIEEYFGAGANDIEWEPRYNIAPTQPVLTLRQNAIQPVRELSLMKWGLIPSWAEDASNAAGMINARSETAASKPAFGDALKFRRCLIPADGFYEWQRTSKFRQPFCFEVREGELFAFAGLWDRWKKARGEWLESCSILTTTGNALTLDIHERMPVILHRDQYDHWLDPGMRNVAVVSELLKPYDGTQMRRYPVSSRVNAVQNDDEACTAPIELAPRPVQTSLLA